MSVEYKINQSSQMELVVEISFHSLTCSYLPSLSQTHHIQSISRQVHISQTFQYLAQSITLESLCGINDGESTSIAETYSTEGLSGLSLSSSHDEHYWSDDTDEENEDCPDHEPRQEIAMVNTGYHLTSTNNQSTSIAEILCMTRVVPQALLRKHKCDQESLLGGIKYWWQNKVSERLWCLSLMYIINTSANLLTVTKNIAYNEDINYTCWIFFLKVTSQQIKSLPCQR